MIEELFDFLSNSLQQNFGIALFASFVWGLVSILLSPCHLSSIPLIVGFINSTGKLELKNTFKLSLVFSLGILVTIAAIGVITASLGRLMGDVGQFGNYFVVAVFFVVGLYLMDIIKLPWDGPRMKGTKHKGLMAAFILGLIFGVGLGPCTFAFMAPVLGVVFEVSRTNIIYAIGLLLAFALGHCGVIILAGTLTSRVQQYLNWTENSPVVGYIKKVCGIIIILAGIYMLYNNM